MIKVTDLEYFIFIAFKKFAFQKRWHWPGVYVSPCSLALVLTEFWHEISMEHMYSEL